MLSQLFRMFRPEIPDRRGLLDLSGEQVKEAMQVRGMDGTGPPGPPAYVRRYRSASVYRLPGDAALTTAFENHERWITSDGAQGSSLIQRNLYVSGDRLKRLGLDLPAIDLRRADFYNSCFDDVDLRDAQMKTATLTRAVFWQTDLTSANLQEADLSNANLEDADLHGADLSGATLTHARLSRATLTGVNLDHSTLRQTIVRRADLSGATLKNATVIGADFSHSTMEGVVAAGSETTVVNTVLPHADLRQSDFSHAKLLFVDFRGTWLEEANFQSANFNGASFRGANTWKTDFAKATLEFIDFSGVDLRESELAYANLYQANFQHALLERQKLKNADALRAVNFAKSNVSRAELPDDLSSFHGLAVVNTATEKAQKLFIALGIACLYAVLAIVVECAGDNCVGAPANLAAGTSVEMVVSRTDRAEGAEEELQSPEREPEAAQQRPGVTVDRNTEDQPTDGESGGENTLTLPFVLLKVSLHSFLIVAPLLLTLAFGYLHLQLQRLWEGIARLPAIFPDGQTVDRRIQPWLVTGIVYAYFPYVRERVYGGLAPPAYFAIHKWAIIALTWGLVPFTQWVFLYHSYHLYGGRQGLTFVIFIGCILTLIGAVHGFAKARETLAGETLSLAHGDRRTL